MECEWETAPMLSSSTIFNNFREATWSDFAKYSMTRRGRPQVTAELLRIHKVRGAAAPINPPLRVCQLLFHLYRPPVQAKLHVT